MTMISLPQGTSPATLDGQFICRTCHHIHADRLDDCPRCDTLDAFAPIRSWQVVRPEEFLSEDAAERLLKASAQMLTEYENLGVLHPQYIAFENVIATEYDRKEIGRLVADEGVHAAVPGIITLHEFRTRYGYRCKRIPCTFCQDFHYRGSNGANQTCWNIAGPSNMDSGTRYRVSRADETPVAIELSATTTWKTAYKREYARFVPILIARDALVEDRIEDARQIANRLTPDLADQLRREINYCWANKPDSKTEERSDGE